MHYRDLLAIVMVFRWMNRLHLITPRWPCQGNAGAQSDYGLVLLKGDGIPRAK
jgi:hypothetical protein